MRRSRALFFGLLLALVSTAAHATCQGQAGSGLFCGNSTASTGQPTFGTISALLDRAVGSTQGLMLARGASVWAATATPALGLNGTAGGSLTLAGATSGSSTITVAAAAGTSTNFRLPINNGTNNFVLITDGSGNTSWVSNAAGGTVTSVALTMPAIYSVAGSPVTSSGTLAVSLANESANLVWAGPTTGAAAAPTFRSLVGADLPNPTTSSLGGVQANNAVSHQWINAINTSGVPQLSQPAFSDISGSITAAQCVLPTASTVGCVESIAAVTSNWIRSISTSGVPALSQPNFTDIAGNASLAQLPSISNNEVLGNNSGGTAVPSPLTASQVLDMIGSVQGDVLYRNASNWVVLAPGTNGQVLTTAGAAANPTWTTVTGTGTVTSIATSGGLTGGTITTTGTLSLASIATGNVLAYTGAGSGTPVATTPSAVLDVIGSTTGDVLYRAAGGTGWQVLAPGTNGQVLTMGASTPSWSNAGTLTNVTIAAGTGLAVAGTCNISTTGTCTVSLSNPVSATLGGTGVASPTAHTIPINEGASAQANTGTGTAGQCVNSGGGSADPSYVSGCWVLINTLTANNTATTLADTTSITATYTEYEIVFEQILPATNNITFSFQFQVGGTFQSTNYLSSSNNSNGAAVASQLLTTGVLFGSVGAVVNTAPGVSGRYLLSNPGQTLTCKIMMGQYAYITTTSMFQGVSSGCYNGGSGAITGVQITTSSGNITSGKMKIYGRVA
jgi:hypothetical protein